MEIYLEYILFENILVNYIIVSQISIFTKIKLNTKNKIVGILLMSIYTILSYAKLSSLLSSVFAKIMMVNVFLYILFLPKKLNVYFKQIIYYYMISSIYTGVIISISLLFNVSLDRTINKITIYIISALIIHMLNKILWKMWKNNITDDSLIYDVHVDEYKFRAFVDTGNSVKDSVNGLDVIFVQDDIYDILYKKLKLCTKVNIDISTVSSKDVFTGYVIDNVFVQNKKGHYYFPKIIFVFVDRKFNSNLNYKALIGYDTYVEKLKGVYL